MGLLGTAWFWGCLEVFDPCLEDFIEMLSMLWRASMQVVNGIPSLLSEAHYVAEPQQWVTQLAACFYFFLKKHIHVKAFFNQPFLKAKHLATAVANSQTVLWLRLGKETLVGLINDWWTQVESILNNNWQFNHYTASVCERPDATLGVWCDHHKVFFLIIQEFHSTNLVQWWL